NKDATVRYAALSHLAKLVRASGNVASLQRHRRTVLLCLSETSLSVRRRALALLVLLADVSSAKALVADLLQTLDETVDELRPELITSVAFIAEHYAPSPKWHFDILLRMLQTDAAALQSVGHDIIANTASLLQRQPVLRQHACKQLFLSLQGGQCSKELITTAVFVLGEYPESCLAGEPHVTSEELVSVISTHLDTPGCRDLVVTALGKIAAKIPETKQSIGAMYGPLRNSLAVETQKRVVEYSAVLCAPGALAMALLEPIDAPPLRETEAGRAGNEEEEEEEVEAGQDMGGDLVDLGMDGDSGAAQAPPAEQDLMDVLMGLSPAPTPSPARSGGNSGMGDLMSELSSPAVPSETVVYKGHGVTIGKTANMKGDAIVATFRVTTVLPKVSVSLAFSKPPNATLQLQPVSGKTTGMNEGPITQQIRLAGTKALRIKLDLVLSGGATHTEIVTVRDMMA
ncbi:hypothetical protein KIPB_011858, partial [Kipferlia bialata]